MDNIELTDEMRERVLKNVKAAAADSASEASAQERASTTAPKASSQERASTSATAAKKSPATPVPIKKTKKKANRTMMLAIFGYAAACILISVGVFFSWRSSQNGKLDPTTIDTTGTETVITATSDSGIMAGGPDGSDPSQSGNVIYPLEFDNISGINKEYDLKLSDLTTLPFTPTKTSYMVYSYGAEIIYSGKESEECCWHICRESKPIDDIAENFPIHKTVETADGTTITLYNGETNYFMAIWFDGTNYQSLQFITNVPEETFITIIEEIKGMQ